MTKRTMSLWVSSAIARRDCKEIKEIKEIKDIKDDKLLIFIDNKVIVCLIYLCQNRCPFVSLDSDRTKKSKTK